MRYEWDVYHACTYMRSRLVNIHYSFLMVDGKHILCTATNKQPLTIYGSSAKRWPFPHDYSRSKKAALIRNGFV